MTSGGPGLDDERPRTGDTTVAPGADPVTSAASRAPGAVMTGPGAAGRGPTGRALRWIWALGIVGAAGMALWVGLGRPVEGPARLKGNNISSVGHVELDAVAEGATVTDLRDGDVVPSGAEVVFTVSTDSTGFLYLVQRRESKTTHLTPEDGRTWSVRAGRHEVGGDVPTPFGPSAGSGLYDYEVWFCHGALRDVPEVAPPGCVSDSITLTWPADAP